MDSRPKPRRLSLLIADVDGTRVDQNKVLTERAAAAVHALRQTVRALKAEREVKAA